MSLLNFTTDQLKQELNRRSAAGVSNAGIDGQPTFDQLPAYVAELGQKVEYLIKIIGQGAGNSDRWLSIEELQDYLPGRPSITTLYGKVQRNEIPFHKMGKRLIFRQSEIETWLLTLKSDKSKVDSQE
jgi:excisionase family DNA binding protein